MLKFRPEPDPGGQGTGNNGEEGKGTPETPPSPEDTSSTPPAGEEPKGQDDQTASLRKEAAKYRTERNALAKKVEELEGAQKSDVEKLTDRSSKLEADNSDLAAKNRSLRVQVLANQVGIVDPELAAMSLEKQDLDWEDDGVIEKALQKLVKDKPHLAGSIPGGSDGGAGTQRRPETQDMNQLIRASAGRE